MSKRKITWYVETDLGGRIEGEFYVEDVFIDPAKATDDEIVEYVREEVFNCITWGWGEEDEEETSHD